MSDPELEDGFRPADPTPVLLDNLDRRCTILGEPRRTPLYASDLMWVIEITERVARLYRKRRELSDIQRAQLSTINEDLQLVRRRLNIDSRTDG